MSDDLRPRRSVLYMPAANAKALEKAQTIPCDAIIFDLEDAVAPDAKDRRAQAWRRPPLRASTAGGSSPSAATGSTPRGGPTTGGRGSGRRRRRW